MKVEIIETFKPISGNSEPERVNIFSAEIMPWERIDTETMAKEIYREIRAAKETNHAPVSISFDILFTVNGVSHFADMGGNLASQLASWAVADRVGYEKLVRSYESGKVKMTRCKGDFMVHPKVKSFPYHFD